MLHLLKLYHGRTALPCTVHVYIYMYKCRVYSRHVRYMTHAMRVSAAYTRSATYFTRQGLALLSAAEAVCCPPERCRSRRCCSCPGGSYARLERVPRPPCWFPQGDSTVPHLRCSLVAKSVGVALPAGRVLWGCRVEVESARGQEADADGPPIPELAWRRMVACHRHQLHTPCVVNVAS